MLLGTDLYLDDTCQGSPRRALPGELWTWTSLARFNLQLSITLTPLFTSWLLVAPFWGPLSHQAPQKSRQLAARQTFKPQAWLIGPAIISPDVPPDPPHTTMTSTLSPPHQQDTPLSPPAIPPRRNHRKTTTRREQERMMMMQPHQCFADIYQISPPRGRGKTASLSSLLRKGSNSPKGIRLHRDLNFIFPLSSSAPSPSLRRSRTVPLSYENPSSERFSPGAAAKRRLLPPVSRRD